MSGLKTNFAEPLIIGALCERESEIPSALKKMFAKLKPQVAFLPFEVEKRHLKNTIACMKLMDVHGLVILGSHKNKVCHHIPKLSKAAKESGCVDIVKRQGKSFIGLKVDLKNSKAGVGIFYQTCVEILTPRGKWRN